MYETYNNAQTLKPYYDINTGLHKHVYSNKKSSPLTLSSFLSSCVSNQEDHHKHHCRHLEHHDLKRIGKIKYGNKIASNLYNYPTANVILKHGLPLGVYNANSNYGPCICLIGKKDFLECHIKNFNKNIYDKYIKLENISLLSHQQLQEELKRNPMIRSFVSVMKGGNPVMKKNRHKHIRGMNPSARWGVITIKS